MSSGIYTKFKYNMMAGGVNLTSDTIRCALYDSSFSFSESQASYSSSNEVSGDGYSAGGAELSNKSVSEGSTTYFDADDVSWESASFSAAYALLYDDSATYDDTIACFDFGETKTVSSGTFTIQWDAAGIITLT